MESSELYIAIVIMAIANLLTRALPFLFFAKKEPPHYIIFIEQNFPPIIMVILIFYTLSSIDLVNQLYGLKEIVAIGITAYLHIKFNNYLVSIFLGTLFYMFLVQFAGF